MVMECTCMDNPSLCLRHADRPFQERIAAFYLHALRTSQRRFQAQSFGSMRIAIQLNRELVPHLCPAGAEKITLTALFNGDGDITDWDILVEDGSDTTRWAGMGERALRERLGG